MESAPAFQGRRDLLSKNCLQGDQILKCLISQKHLSRANTTVFEENGPFAW